MKKLLIATLFLLLSTLSYGQYVYLIPNSFAATGSGAGSNISNTGAFFHKLSWSITGGTLSACTVAVDSSADGASWTAGGIIAGQTCTSNGTITSASTSTNFIRVTVTTFTSSGGTPSLNTQLFGYVNNPAGGGGSAFSGGSGSSFQDVVEIAAPANPAAGTERLYTNSTSHTLQCLLSTGASCNPTAAAGGSTTTIQYNNAGALAGITQWTTNGTTTITESATGILDLHSGAVAGLLLSGSLATGLVRVTTATGAMASAELSGDATTSGSNAVTVVRINGTSLAGLATGIYKNTTGTGVPSIAVAGDFPTLNQNTTGSAATWTTARLLAGNSVNGSANVAFSNLFIVQGTTDAGLSGAQFLGALATGILKNTTTTGVLSIAVAGDFPTLNQNTTGSAASLNAVSALPNGTTATTQAALDNTTKVATDAFVLANAVTNPMTTLGDTTYGGASGVFTRLAGPTTPNGVPQTLTSTPSGGLAVAPAWNLSGVPTDAQVGTSYTIAATDRASYVSFSNAAAIAVTLPQANSAGFGSNFVFVACDIGAGTATITPTTSNISYSTGNSYSSAQTTLALTTGQCAWIYSDNTNYFAIVRAAASAGANTALSNLASVAVNLALSPGTDASISLDDLTHRYINVWLSGVLGWTNGSGTADTGISRGAAGEVDFGNGTAADKTGTVKLASLNASSSLSTGTAPAGTAGTGGVWFYGEGTAPTGAASVDAGYANSTTHCFAINNNNNDVGCAVTVPAVIDLTAQSAAKTATNLYLPPFTGRYDVCYYLKVTTAATTSSILGGTTGVVIAYTDGTDSVAQTVTLPEFSQAGANVAIGTGNTGNATTSVLHGCGMLFMKTGVQSTYAIGYSSTGATAMQYEAHLTVRAAQQ